VRGRATAVRLRPLGSTTRCDEFQRREINAQFLISFTARSRIGILVVYHPGAGFLRHLFPGCLENRRTEKAHNECAASLNIVGQHRSGIPMPLHLARDLSAIGKPHLEALDG
jgi:hypothetical protein